MICLLSQECGHTAFCSSTITAVTLVIAPYISCAFSRGDLSRLALSLFFKITSVAYFRNSIHCGLGRATIRRSKNTSFSCQLQTPSFHSKYRDHVLTHGSSTQRACVWNVFPFYSRIDIRIRCLYLRENLR